MRMVYVGKEKSLIKYGDSCECVEHYPMYLDTSDRSSYMNTLKIFKIKGLHVEYLVHEFELMTIEKYRDLNINLILNNG